MNSLQQVVSDSDNVVGEGMFEESQSKSSIASLSQLEYSDDELLNDRLDSGTFLIPITDWTQVPS